MSSSPGPIAPVDRGSGRVSIIEFRVSLIGAVGAVLWRRVFCDIGGVFCKLLLQNLLNRNGLVVIACAAEVCVVKVDCDTVLLTKEAFFIEVLGGVDDIREHAGVEATSEDNP